MSGAEPRARGRAESLVPLGITALFSLPLWADPVAQSLGYDVFYLADPKLQAVYAALVQLCGGGPLYVRAAREARGRRIGRAGWAAVLSTLLYAGGFTAAVRGAPAIHFFLAAGAVLFAGHVLSWRASRAAR
ncbi:MAG: hypothetical protein DIU55_002560 [Bacillota bacterium]|nr:MAG: hypothetical protein DIU55_07850 [Bacillota bacterium]